MKWVFKWYFCGKIETKGCFLYEFYVKSNVLKIDHIYAAHSFNREFINETAFKRIIETSTSAKNIP